MNAISVIVTTCNNRGTIISALESVRNSLRCLESQGGRFACIPREVLIIDDGSTDGTPDLVNPYIEKNSGFAYSLRPTPRSPAAARNDGVQLARGDLIYFLDGDDRFGERHLFECYQAMEDRRFGFVKTQVTTSDPVHPSWLQRIRHSLVINLCVRRVCHEFIGGFPDYHICTRRLDRLRSEIDVFFKIEDVFYNMLLLRYFRMAECPATTAEYLRHPGNSFDRQYAKFQIPPGLFHEPQDQDLDLRIKIGELLLEQHCRRLDALPRPAHS